MTAQDGTEIQQLVSALVTPHSGPLALLPHHESPETTTVPLPHVAKSGRVPISQPSRTGAGQPIPQCSAMRCQWRSIGTLSARHASQCSTTVQYYGPRTSRRWYQRSESQERVMDETNVSSGGGFRVTGRWFERCKIIRGARQGRPPACVAKLQRGRPGGGRKERRERASCIEEGKSGVVQT